MKFTPDLYEEFIRLRTYARYDNKKKRRETWDESVERYRAFMLEQISKYTNDMKVIGEFNSAVDKIKDFEVMPSMRALWSAGPAARKENIAVYNCAATTITSIRDFAEILYILMCGAGVGFSVERQFINQLPEVKELTGEEAEYTVPDSRLGWAEALYFFLRKEWAGIRCKMDLSRIRPAGAPLKTFGGRASGPEVLDRLFQQLRAILDNARGRKLYSIECHDMVCHIAECVIVGGVRRSSTISLSNLSDRRMRHAKDGEFWIANPQRTLANNSAVYMEKPSPVVFMEEWMALMKSGTGERGIVNREALTKTIPDRRDRHDSFLLNPCGEIILRPKQFCNLSEAVVRPWDTEETLREKVRAAAILAIVQSTLTDFGFLSKEWKKNCEEERLLGVSLTGIMDNYDLLIKREGMLQALKAEVILTASKWSEYLGITMPKATTCVKPSGTVSQLVDCSSGLHARYSDYYIRRVRVAASDPLAKFLIDKGVPHHPEVGQTADNCTTWVFDFVKEAPKLSKKRKDVSAIDQLKVWRKLKTEWCEHNPSCTIYVKDEEWLEVGAWVYKNWDVIGGISFLPYSNKVYQLAPYEEINRETYLRLKKEQPQIDFSEFIESEQEDNTTGSKEYACVGDKCEI